MQGIRTVQYHNAMQYHPLHEIIISKPIIITRRISLESNIPRRNQRNLVLRLALLSSLLRVLLSLHLLVAHCRQRRGDLLDFGAAEFFDELLAEFLKPDGIMRLLRIRREKRDKRARQRRELVFRLGRKEGHG